MRKTFFGVIFFLFCFSLLFAQDNQEDILPYFIVLNYPNITSTGSNFSVSKKTFQIHMQYLKDNNYAILGIGDLEGIYFKNKEVPKKAVVLVFSGGQRQTLEIASPILKKFNFNAVFILNIGGMKEKSTYYISWHDAWLMNEQKKWEFGILVKEQKELIDYIAYVSLKLKDIKIITAFVPDKDIDSDILKNNFKISFIYPSSTFYNNKNTNPNKLNILNIKENLKLDVFKNNLEKRIFTQRYYKQIKELAREERYEQLIEVYKKILDIDPRDKNAKVGLAYTYWRKPDLENAQSFCLEILKDNPKNIKILNLLANIYIKKGSYDLASKYLERSLEIDSLQDNVRFRLAKLYGWQTNYNKSINELNFLINSRQINLEDTKFFLAKMLFSSRQYPQAEATFRNLIKANPQNNKYKIGLANALYWQEKYPEAENIVNEILSLEPNNLEALKFKALDYYYQKDLVNAKKLFEKITLLNPEDIIFLNRFAKIAFEIGDYKQAIGACSKSLNYNPRQIDIYLIFADALRLDNRLKEAELRYKEVFELNPNNVAAKIGLIDIYKTTKRFKKALLYLDEVINLDTSNLELYIQKAQILASNKQYKEAIKLLEDKSRQLKNKKSFLVLLYHGLSNRQRDDIVKVDNFKKQMQALKDAGFVFISLEDIELTYLGKVELPSKSVLITFDDARCDSFLFADPILKEFNFKAVMFVPVSFVDKQSDFFASWKDLINFQSTGRWQMQSHGDLAHQNIIVDSAGTSGLFLINKIWYDDNFESDREFITRIENDYLQAKDSLYKNLRSDIFAYALPKGTFGHLDYSNFGDALNINLDLLKKYYKFSFIQNSFGFNYVGDNPFFLKRFEVSFDLDIEEFGKHLTDLDPDSRINLALADILRWAGNKGASLKLYDKLLKENPNNQNILLNKAMVDLESKDYKNAIFGLEKTLEINPRNIVAREKLTEIKNLKHPEILPLVSYFEDNRKRNNLKISNSFVIHPTYNFSLTPVYSKVYLKEGGQGKIHENEYGLILKYARGLRSYLGQILYKDYSLKYSKINYLFEYKTGFSIFDSFIFSTSLKNVERLKAVLNKTTAYENLIMTKIMLPFGFILYNKYQYNDYNDKNERHIAKLALSHLIWQEPKFYLGYEFLYDDAKIDSENYYSPQKLKTNSVRFRLNDDIFNKKLYYDLSYILGYGKEKDSKNRLTNSFEGSINYKLRDNLEFSLTYNISKTPTYRSSTTTGQLRYSF